MKLCMDFINLASYEPRASSFELRASVGETTRTGVDGMKQLLRAREVRSWSKVEHFHASRDTK